MFPSFKFGNEHPEPPITLPTTTPHQNHHQASQPDQRSRSQSSSRSSNIGKAPVSRVKPGRKMSMGDARPTSSSVLQQRGRSMQPLRNYPGNAPRATSQHQENGRPMLDTHKEGERTDSVSPPDFCYSPFGISIPTSLGEGSIWTGSVPSALAGSFGATTVDEVLESPMTPALPLPRLPLDDVNKKQRRRECHNQVEKRRREHINSKIEELSQLVPASYGIADPDMAVDDDDDEELVMEGSPTKKKVGLTRLAWRGEVFKLICQFVEDQEDECGQATKGLGSVQRKDSLAKRAVYTLFLDGPKAQIPISFPRVRFARAPDLLSLTTSIQSSSDDRHRYRVLYDPYTIRTIPYFSPVPAPVSKPPTQIMQSNNGTLTASQMQHHQQQQQQQQQHQQQQQSQPQQHPPSQPWGSPFPSLHLWPVTDHFIMKMIHLPDHQRDVRQIKIGRQTNNKTVPGERNAYFDSKVLSRLHAEIWQESGKMFIKDVKSSNGTFVNGERLSAEGVESDPYELKSEDNVEFGIDIVSEDNRTVVHHKVAAKVYVVFNQEDAALSARELVNYQNYDPRVARSANGQMNGAGGNQPNMGPQVMSSGGKASGLSFEHVLQKLQTELQKSKETGADLQGLATAMTDIQETLGGGLPPAQNGSAANLIPPQYRVQSAEVQAALQGPHGQQAAAFIALQNQLSETQTTLSGQLEKIKHLESHLREHDNIKHEITVMREQMEESKREMDRLLLHRTRDDEDDDDFDDSSSVMTMVEDSGGRERRRSERERRGLRNEVDRPSTPEPNHANANGHASAESDSDEDDRRSTTTSEMVAQNAELTSRIQVLSAEMAEALLLSRNLQSQHSEAMTAVQNLTDRIGVLENGVSSKVVEAVMQAEERWESWRSRFEEGWKRDRESWENERERLRSVIREWEEASRRANEENEDRQMNEHLSEDEPEDEDDDDDDDDGLEEVEQSELITIPKPLLAAAPRKIKRRRQSNKALLAIKALKGVIGDSVSVDEVGTSTPKQSSLPLNETPPQVPLSKSGLRNQGRGERNRHLREGDLKRTGSNSTSKGEKESSESGKESGDTLKEKEMQKRGSRKQPKGLMVQPVPFFTVLVVAIAAGAFYYRQKD
ncbi:hypothetical protein P7C73_g6563, partial [Tremellales sp. Uapishka_1]